MLNKIIKSFGICLSVLFIYNNYAYGITAGSSIGATGSGCVDFSDESTCNDYDCREDSTSGMGGQNCKSYELICYRNGGSGGAIGSVNLFAKSCTACNNGYTFAQSLSSVTSGTAGNCTVKFKTCVKIEGGGDTAKCPSACPSDKEYTVDTRNHREAICDTSTSTPTCKYRCLDGYYNTRLGAVVPSCTSCPSGATCRNSAALCNRGYWRENIENIALGTTTVKCNQCPALEGATGTVRGTTPSDKQVSSMTACYIPASQSIKDTSGTFNFIEDCYYSE